MIKKEIVSIVIPCRNEEKYIEKCIQSVLDFNIPPNLSIELIVVDGFSTDKTWEILQNFKSECLTIITLKNQDIYVSFALNKAIEIAKGDWIMRLDAHSNFPKNYLEKCYETAKATGADNVGGMVITHPGGTGFQAGIVQALTTHIFGVGDSGFRTGIKSGAVDTVPFGFFRREIFQKVGYFDQRLIRAQDYELNARIKSAFGLVWLNPEIKAHYFNQSSFFQFLRKQFLKEAPYNAYLWFLAPYAFAPRHAITGAFALGVLVGFLFSPFTNWILFPFVWIFSLYWILALGASIQQAIRYKKSVYGLILPGCFFLYHFIHGLGVLVGLFKILVKKTPFKMDQEPWPNAQKFSSFR